MKATSLRPPSNVKNCAAGIAFYREVAASVRDPCDEVQPRGHDASAPAAEFHGVHEPHPRHPFTSPIDAAPGDVAS